MFRKRRTGFDEPQDPDRAIRFRGDARDIVAPEFDVPAMWTIAELSRPGLVAQSMLDAAAIVNGDG